MIILRVAGGIRQHFGIRVTEWIMAAPLAGWALGLSLDPHTFASSPSFAEIARWGDEWFWSQLCLLAAFARLTALVVNGTFRAFRFAPHLRAVASAMACVFWGQIALGVFVAWFYGTGAWTGIFAYGSFVLIELWNVFRARADVGAQKGAG